MISGEQPLLTLIRRYRQAGILVDANVLILLFIGILDRSYIERFERTKSYTPEDFGALVQILQYFQRIIVTPHILTEVSNLVGRMHHDRRYAYFQVVRSLLITTPGQFIVDEQYRPAKLIVLEPEFYRLGLTDAGIIHCHSPRGLGHLAVHYDTEVPSFLASRRGPWRIGDQDRAVGGAASGRLLNRHAPTDR